MEEIEINRVDTHWWETRSVSYRDDGYVSVGAKTRKYSLFSRHNNSLIGIVKWMVQYRQYCFWPYLAVLDSKVMREVSEFCEQTTKAHKDRVGRKPPVYKKRLEAKAKYY